MIQKIDSNKFSLTILKVTTFSRIRQFHPLKSVKKWVFPHKMCKNMIGFPHKMCIFAALFPRKMWEDGELFPHGM